MEGRRAPKPNSDQGTAVYHVLLKNAANCFCRAQVDRDDTFPGARSAFRVKVRIMGGIGRSRQLCVLFGLTIAVFALPSAANAAWLGYKNNTNAVVIIQTTDLVVVNGQVTAGRSGKAHALYPGEVAWDPIAAPGPRMITIYDAKQKTRLHQDRVDCNKNDIFLSLQMIQPQAPRGQSAPPPQFKLLPTILPAQAPGILTPGSMPSNPTPGARPTPPSAPPKPPGH
jgi:hypothetical protein